MVLDYFPMDMYLTYEFIQDECGYKDDLSTQEIIYDMLHNSFCKYIIKKGKNESMMCLKKIRKDKYDANNKNIYCHFHRYREKLCHVSFCKLKCKRGHNLCKNHFKYKTVVDVIDDSVVYYSSEHEEKEINILSNINIDTNNKKICNIITLPKCIFDICNYNESTVIKYEYFSIIKLLYEIYIKFKDLIFEILEKYKINLQFLYILLTFLKRTYNLFINTKSYHHKINLNSKIIELPVMYKVRNMQLIQYNKYGYESINKYTIIRVKKYIKNKRKREKQKLNKKVYLEEYNKFCNFINNFDDLLSNEKKLKILVNYDNYKNLNKHEIIYILNEVNEELDKIRLNSICKIVIDNIYIIGLYCKYLIIAIIDGDYSNKNYIKIRNTFLKLEF